MFNFLKKTGFQSDLAKLREKYPMCYIEAWTPDDFNTDWASYESESIANVLSHRFDAEYGTSWMSVESAKEETGVKA